MTRSESVLIEKNKRQPSFSSKFSNEDEISSAAVQMYDSATWRMYYRIMEDRRRRAAIAKQMGLNLEDYFHHDSTDKETTSSSLTKSSSFKEDEQTCEEKVSIDLLAGRSCSLPNDSLQEEGIFEMDL